MTSPSIKFFGPGPITKAKAAIARMAALEARLAALE